MAAEPTPPSARELWAQRWYGWWPPAAAFLAVLIGIPALVLISANAIAGGDDLYSLESTRDCLVDKEGAEVSEREQDLGRDFIAQAAPEGAMKVTIAGNDLVLSFGTSEQDAERTQRAYLRFAGGTIPVQDLLFRERNAVLLWRDPPQPEQRELLVGCLG